MNDHEKRQAELLAAYHEALAADVAATPPPGLEPSLASLARQVQQHAHRNEPSAAFISHLEERLAGEVLHAGAGATARARRDTSEKELTMHPSIRSDVPSNRHPDVAPARKPAPLPRFVPAFASAAAMLAFILGAAYFVSMLASRADRTAQESRFGSNADLAVPTQQPSPQATAASTLPPLSEIVSRTRDAMLDPVVSSFHITLLDRHLQGERPAAAGSVDPAGVFTSTESVWFQAPDRWHIRHSSGVGEGGVSVFGMAGYDGTTLWKYDPPSNQAYATSDVEAEGPDVPLSGVLSIYGLLAEIEQCYNPTVSSDTIAGRETYLLDLGASGCLEPGSEKGLGHRVWLDKETYFALKHVYLDADKHVISSVEAVRVEYNVPIEPAIFSVPAGAELVQPPPEPVGDVEKGQEGEKPLTDAQDANKQP
ncbi:MAG: hypothetical protein M3328_11940 [Chloroflexota bacterium]|nr:hypothetical protein [Chloroflexota bacterium]